MQWEYDATGIQCNRDTMEHECDVTRIQVKVKAKLKFKLVQKKKILLQE